MKLYDDGHKAVQTLVYTMYNMLAGYWKEARDEGIPTDMVYSFYMRATKLEETDRYITYVSNQEGFQGGEKRSQNDCQRIG